VLGALVASVAAAASCPQGAVVIGVGGDPRAIYPDQLALPICLHVGALPNVPSIFIDFQQKHSTSPLCVQTQGVPGGAQTQCSRGGDPYAGLALQLLPPTTAHDYVFYINPTPVTPPPTFSKVSIQVRPDDRYGPLPPLPPGGAYPPPPPARECDYDELNALATCANDAIGLGCDVSNANAELTCLEKRQDHLSSRSCRQAMADLDECLNQRHLLLPMEIASAMLLVTASFTLFCTIVRCCCRRFCTAPVGGSSHPAVSLEEPTELSDASEDEEHTQGQPGGPSSSSTRGSATRAAPAASKGGKGAAGSAKAAAAPAAAEDEEHDDQLPAYTQVVEHSALAVQPLQCSGSGGSAIN